ncbi:MAG: gliding motility-associated C-terminal domain-containing protein, partial [Candidatus Omnitrophica bacterium]|nr:gliding motility-associated C-terminal domain-containing protein [Candidatus Omnitrophota bacterium]
MKNIFVNIFALTLLSVLFFFCSSANAAEPVGYARVSGYVKDTVTKASLDEANVRLKCGNENQDTDTNSSGYYEFPSVPIYKNNNTYISQTRIIVSSGEYKTEMNWTDLVPGQNYTADFYLETRFKYPLVSGQVIDKDTSVGIEGATVTVSNEKENYSCLTDAGGHYTLRIEHKGVGEYTAYAAADNYQASETQTITTYPTKTYTLNFSCVMAADLPPSAPQGLTLANSDGLVQLSWTANTEPDLSGYNVYRAEVSGGPYIKLNTLPLSQSLYTDSGLNNGTIYHYVVTAVDTAGNESDYSQENSAMPSEWLTIMQDRPDAFSPNNDGTCDVSVLTYELIRDALITLSVYDAANQPVRVWEENIAKTSGTHTVEWNGCNDNAEVLPDGAYTYVVKAQDALGGWSQKQAQVTIDNHFMQITEPVDNELYLGERLTLIAVVSAYVHNISDVYFYYRSKGDTDWTVFDKTLVLREDGSYELYLGSANTHHDEFEVCVSASYIDLNNEVRTEYSTPVTYVFSEKITVLRASDSPDAFSPNGSGDFDESIITYEIINAEGFITTKIYDGNNNLIKVLERQSPKTIGTHTVIWNGRSRIDGDFAPDGTYTYVITAEDGEGNRHEKQGEVSLDNHFMRIVEPLPETLLMGEVTFKAVPSPYTRDIANVHFLFSPEGTSQTTGYEAALQPDGTWSCVWNADNAQSGRYGVRVSAYYTDLNNQFRCELTKFDMFTVPDYVRISDVFDENDAFSPNEDGNYDTAMIHYQISRDALMSVELFDAGKTLVRTLKQDVSEPGMYVVEWDGRDDASNVLDEGTYTYVITAKTPAEGYVSQKQGTLSIDNHPLVISPAPGSVVSGNVIFTLMPSEYIKSVYRVFLYYRLKGESTFYSLTDVMTGAPQDTDGTYKVNWDTESIINGDYEIEARIEYRDLSNGNREDIFSPLNYTVSNPILIFDVSDAPDPFSPNEDFISDTTTISYQLVNSGANVSIKIYDGEGVLVRVLKENVSEQQGVQSAVWDGKGSNESIVSDGIYTYRIEAADAQGNTAQKQGQVTVDNHAVTIIEPQEGGVVSSDVVLRAVPSAFCQNVRSIYFSVRHTASYVYFRKSLGPAVQDSDGNWTVQWSTADIPAGEYELYARISFIDNNGQMRSENSARIRCTLATGNMLSYISDAPDAFSPNGDGKYDISTISYVLSIGSSVNLKIYDAQGLLVRTLKENETQTIGFNNNLWDGKNDNGNILPDGMYSYIIEADFQGICQDQEQGTIAVDNQIASFIQPVPDSSLSGAVTLKIMPSPYMSDVTGIRMETTPGGGLGAAVKQSDGNWEAVWDTTGYSNGSYNVRAYVTFMDLNGKGRGEWTKAQVYTIANGMAVSRNAFSPNADAYYDTTAFLYNMASAGAVTVKIYDANQNPVRTIKENIFEQVGANQAVWNGKDNNANVLGDGTYSYVIDIDYGSGNTAQQEGTVAIDNHFLRITQPAAGDSLNSTVNLTVAPSAYVGNIDMRRVRFYYRKKGDTTWQHQTFNWLYQQPDGSWQLVWDVSALVNVEYELCVSATYNDLNNLARTETSLPVTYKIANPFSLINVSDAPDAFSPNGDNNSDTTTIKYFINSDALVTISIYDAGGNLLRTLKENILETAGNHTAVWGGKDQNGLTLNDGTYAYVIEATDNQSNKLQQSGESSIDNNVIRITEPAPDSTISGNVKLKINFSSFVLSERGICLQTTSLMNNFIVYGAKDIDGSWSIPIDTKIIPNGPFEFKIIAGYYDLNNVSRYEIIYCAYTVFN